MTGYTTNKGLSFVLMAVLFNPLSTVYVKHFSMLYLRV